MTNTSIRALYVYYRAVELQGTMERMLVLRSTATSNKSK